VLAGFHALVGTKKPVTGRYVLIASNRIGFRLGGYDHARFFMIDPRCCFVRSPGGAVEFAMGNSTESSN